jgi:hypothetical protein
MMGTDERNQMIRDIRRAFPYWDLGKIADLVGSTLAEVHNALKEKPLSGIMRSDMTDNETFNIGNKPISASEVTKRTGIPASTIGMWVKRNQVKVISDPGQTGPGLFVLLDPVTLQQQIDKYKPRKKKIAA